jgi:hypothetical protein
MTKEGYLKVHADLWDYIPVKSHIRYLKRDDTAHPRPRGQRFKPGGFVKSHFADPSGHKMLMLETILGRQSDAAYLSFPLAYAEVETIWKKYSQETFIETLLIYNSLAYKSKQIEDMRGQLTTMATKMDRMAERIETQDAKLAKLRAAIAPLRVEKPVEVAPAPVKAAPGVAPPSTLRTVDPASASQGSVGVEPTRQRTVSARPAVRSSAAQEPPASSPRVPPDGGRSSQAVIVPARPTTVKPTPAPTPAPTSTRTPDYTSMLGLEPDARPGPPRWSDSEAPQPTSRPRTVSARPADRSRRGVKDDPTAFISLMGAR